MEASEHLDTNVSDTPPEVPVAPEGAPAGSEGLDPAEHHSDSPEAPGEPATEETTVDEHTDAGGDTSAPEESVPATEPTSDQTHDVSEDHQDGDSDADVDVPVHDDPTDEVVSEDTVKEHHDDEPEHATDAAPTPALTPHEQSLHDGRLGPKSNAAHDIVSKLHALGLRGFQHFHL